MHKWDVTIVNYFSEFFRIFKLSDIDQGIHKHAIQINRNFYCFWKKIKWKKSKAKIIVSRTTLCTQKIKLCMQKKFFRKMLFCVQKSIYVWKNPKKFLGKFSKLLETIFFAPSLNFPLNSFGIVFFVSTFQKVSIGAWGSTILFFYYFQVN